MKKFYEFPVNPTAKEVLEGYGECYDEARKATDEFYEDLNKYEKKLMEISSLARNIVCSAQSNPDPELRLNQFAMVVKLEERVNKLLDRFNGLRCEMKAYC